ncbi:hypothetical protein J5226_12820 [Lysobacter sp. K5869]|uniref:hypothetical protein n=1 Tax=Lysobacter sp. K5869 TaxID=2820808 RepID=UPI001C061C24|nr:hypothetical protein [Lysobacter sp. K5869]QWP79207.1 hypothetical protein J5226_12820 [Lysobacter sp. K5869]
MSVSHCMGRALKIARLPVGQWPDEVAKLPEDCAHADCSAPRSCRKRIGAYLAIQRGILRDRPAPARGRR